MNLVNEDQTAFPLSYNNCNDIFITNDCALSAADQRGVCHIFPYPALISYSPWDCPVISKKKLGVEVSLASNCHQKQRSDGVLSIL